MMIKSQTMWLQKMGIDRMYGRYFPADKEMKNKDSSFIDDG